MIICKKCNTEYSEKEGNFWHCKGYADGYDSTCITCRKAYYKEERYQPDITKDWPKNEQGRWLNYWEIIDPTIILRLPEDES